MGLLFLLLFLLLVVIVPTIILGALFKRGREVRLLAVGGIDGQATVIRMLYRNETKREGFYGIIYEFKDPAGGVHRKNVHLNMDEEGKFTEGGSVRISYRADHPSVNA